MNKNDAGIMPCYGRYYANGKCARCALRGECRDSKLRDDASAVKDRVSLEKAEFLEELSVCPEVLEMPSGRVLSGWKAITYFIRMFCNLHKVTQLAINEDLKSCGYSRKKFLNKLGITEDSFGHIMRSAPASVRNFLHIGGTSGNSKKLAITAEDFVYISGPMTGLPDNNYPAFHAAEQYLTATYHPRHVINPAFNSEMIGPQRDHALYMALAMAEVKASTCLYLLPGWQESKGACQEVKYAKKLGRKIYEEEV